MGSRSPVPDDDPRIVATTLERVSLGTTIMLVGIVVAFGLSTFVRIPQPPPVIAVNGIGVSFSVAMLWAIRRRRVPRAAVHVMAASLWLVAPVNSLLSFALTQDRNLVFPIMIEIALAGVMQTQVRNLLLSTSAVVVTYFALELPSGDPDTTLHVASVGGVAVATWLVGRGIRRALDTAIHRDDEQLATARLLERELEERRRAEQEREGLRDQFVHAQRMDAVGTMAAGLAHDMNNIIAGILGLAEVAAVDVTEPTLRADLDAIAREARRAADLTRGLLAFSRRGKYRKAIVAVDAVVDEVEPLLARMFAGRITLERRGGADVVIDADSAQLGQAIVNLCMNGADAMAGSGALTITTSVVTEVAQRHGLGPGPFAAISVRDHGRGMDDEVKARIFEPFFTTKPIGEGTGLGLAMVYGTVRGHEGVVEVESAPGAGSTFTIYLPVSTQPAVPRVVTARDSARMRAPTRLALVVDDEPVVRAIATRILRQMGLSVVGASDGAEALEVFAARKDEISLVMLDMSMPVMGGAECFRELRRKSRVPIVIASGFANEAETQVLLTQGNTVFLEKPFSVDAMRAHVTRVLERAQG